MFKTLYRCARTAARHENGLASQSRLSYLEHLAEGGATLHCLRAYAGVLYRAAVCMNLDDTSPVERTAVETAAKEWAHRKYLNAMAFGPENTEKEFRYFTCRWLRFAGRLRESDKPPIPHEEALAAYCRYMTEERGLAEATVVSSRLQLIKFLKYTAGKTLEQMRLVDVERFLASLGERGWTRHGINSMGHIIRGFFKYAEMQKWTRPGISAEIHGPRVYRQEHLPLGPTWFDVQRLLASTETDHPYDKRDRAILLLLAVYGMRVRVFLRALVNLDPYSFVDDVAEHYAAADDNNQQTSEEILLSTIDGLADDKLTRFALRLVLTGHTPIPRESEIDFLTEAEAAFAPPQPKKTTKKKENKPTVIKDPTSKKTAAKKTAAA